MTASAANTAPKKSQGVTRAYRLVGTAFVLREPHPEGPVSFQVRFRLNRRAPVDRAGGAKLHVDLTGEGPQTVPFRAGPKPLACYGSQIDNDYGHIPADAKTLALSIKIGAASSSIVLHDQAKVLGGHKTFIAAVTKLGCKQ